MAADGSPAAAHIATVMQAECDFGHATDTLDALPQTVVQVVLSPRMPYALKEWRRMEAAARQAGFRVMAFRDPRVPDAEWQDAVMAANLPELRDVPVVALAAARACGVLNHAPATVVARCGRVHPWPILGVMPDQAWLHLLKARSAGLETGSCA